MKFVCCACVPDDDHHETVRETPLMLCTATQASVETPAQASMETPAEASMETPAPPAQASAEKAMTPEQALAGVIVLAVWYTYTVRLVKIFVPRA